MEIDCTMIEFCFVSICYIHHKNNQLRLFIVEKKKSKFEFISILAA